MVNGHLEVVVTFMTVIRLNCKIIIFLYSGRLVNPFTATRTMSHYDQFNQCILLSYEYYELRISGLKKIKLQFLCNFQKRTFFNFQLRAIRKTSNEKGKIISYAKIGREKRKFIDYLHRRGRWERYRCFPSQQHCSCY